jgi:hypothetical protein
MLWIVMPCGLVGRYQSFGATYCLYPHDSTYKHIQHHNPEEHRQHGFTVSFGECIKLMQNAEINLPIRMFYLKIY